MISTSDFKKGQYFEWEGEPWVVLESNSQSPSARGGATLIKAKVKNVLTGQFRAVTFKAGEKFKLPDLELKPAQYIYQDGELYYFMDQESYEQHPIGAGVVGERADFLKESMELRLRYFNGKPVDVELPNTDVYTITECEPGVKGDTVSNVTKPATLESGAVVQVPLFVEEGDRIRVDLRDARYIERVR